MTHTAMPNAASNVRFSTSNQSDFNKTLRKRVDDFFKSTGASRQANLAMKVKSVVLLSAYLVPLALLLIYSPTFWVGLGIWALMGVAVAGIGMAVMHDANHGAYSKNAKVNEFIGYTINLLGGASVNWKMQHNVLHHTYTNIAGKDNDIDGAGTLRFHPHGEAKEHHKRQWFYAFFLYAILTLFWAIAKDFIQYYRYQPERMRSSTPKQERLLLFKLIALKVFYFATFLGLPLVLTTIPVWQVLVGFVVMHLISGLILSVVFQLAHVVEDIAFPLPNAEGKMEDSWWAHQLRTTANFSGTNKLMTWYTGGLNHQVEHHLFPNICHVHYAQLAPIVRDTALEFGLPYQEYPTFMQAMRSHIVMLKRFGAPTLYDIGD
jgi:linoleoyl-CoA desaturase